ncbi:hypothetical protein TIFTF001_012663 [Ficus carica]|uniref:Uncharacterized protein n=1 Tax=Ficus carica TaxID=3494 RepID=A0AA88A0R7_FICCA|nr:hypothetical protein TIFTF001_012663 [Ficus carica]
MAVTMGVQSSSWNLDDPCSSSANDNVNISCTFANDGVYHITELRLKDLLLPGKLPPELVNLTHLQKVDFTRNFLHGSLPATWSTMKYLNYM